MRLPSLVGRGFRVAWLSAAGLYALGYLGVAVWLGSGGGAEIRVGLLLLAFLGFLAGFFFFFYDLANLSNDRRSVLLHDLRLVKPPVWRFFLWIAGAIVAGSLLVGFLFWRSA